MPLVEAREICRRSSSTSALLLDKASLAIQGGDRVAVMGPAGSGKTLLLRALSALDPVDAGSIVWRGNPLTSPRVPEYRRHVMYLHQRPALIAGTVSENLQWPFTLHVYRDRQFDKERVLKMLAAVGRGSDFLDKSHRDLSGGERQIASLLRALQLDPTVLLLDEPTSALDSDARQAVEELIIHWHAERPHDRALLWVTHDSEQARRVSGRVLTMSNRRLTAET